MINFFYKLISYFEYRLLICAWDMLSDCLPGYNGRIKASQTPYFFSGGTKPISNLLNLEQRIRSSRTGKQKRGYKLFTLLSLISREALYIFYRLMGERWKDSHFQVFNHPLTNLIALGLQLKESAMCPGGEHVNYPTVRSQVWASSSIIPHPLTPNWFTLYTKIWWATIVHRERASSPSRSVLGLMPALLPLSLFLGLHL